MSVPGVILAMTGERESGLARALAARADVAVVRRCADLAEAVAAARAGMGRLVVVSDQPQLTRDVVAELRHDGVAVVGLPSSAQAADRLRSLGVPALAAHDADDGDVADAVAVAATGGALRGADAPVAAGDGAGAAGVAASRRRGLIVAVWGPTGAPGRTTVAVNLAAEAARAGYETLLVDADTYGGAVAQACGLLDESPGIAALARVAQHGPVTPADIASHALSIADGLRVVTGISRPARWIELPSAALDEVWEVARGAADVTVVDCAFGLESDEDLTFDTRAPQRHGATLSALAAADRVIAVGTAEPLGIQRLIHGLADLREVGIVAPVVAVNRVRADVAGSRPDEAVADALARYAGIERAWVLPWDPRAADAATLAGRTLAERAPRSRLRRAIASIAAAVIEDRVERSSARTPADATGALSH